VAAHLEKTLGVPKMIKGYYFVIERIELGVRDQPQLHLFGLAVHSWKSLL